MILKAWKLLTSEVRFGEKKPPKMDLQARMELRKDMVHQSVREHLLALEVLAGMYRFRVMAVDPRAHHFLVLIEIGTQFDPKKAGLSLSMAQVAEHLQVRTRERYGVHIDDVFWKINDHVARFEDSSRSTDGVDTRVAQLRANMARPKLRPDGEMEQMKLSRGRTSQISDSEFDRLRSAVRQNKPVPAIRVGDEVYETSMAPLQ